MNTRRWLSLRRAALLGLLSGLLLACRPSPTADPGTLDTGGTRPPAATAAPSPSPADPGEAPLAETPAGEEPAAGGQTLAWESLAQGDSFTANLEAPTVRLVGTPDEADQLAELLGDNPEAVARLQSTDLAASRLLAVFRGMVGTSGYGITVEAITATPDGVEIIVSLSEPAADQMVNEVLSYPFHVVRLAASDSLASGTAWSLVTTEGATLAAGTFP